jgi:hypothetical protein
MDEDNKLDLINTSITLNSNGKNNILFSKHKAPFSSNKEKMKLICSPKNLNINKN